MIVKQEVFENGGYWLRKVDGGLILDICKDGKCWSVEKTDMEFLLWKLDKEVLLLDRQIKRVNNILGVVDDEIKKVRGS